MTFTDHLDDGAAAREHAAAALVSSPSIEGVLSDEVLDGLRELGDPEFLAELIGDYLTSMGPYLDQLDAAVAAGDADSVYKTAHTMKSSSANMGAMQLADMCKDIEAQGRGGDLAGVGAKVAELKSHYVLVETALNAEVS